MEGLEGLEAPRSPHAGPMRKLQEAPGDPRRPQEMPGASGIVNSKAPSVRMRGLLSDLVGLLSDLVAGLLSDLVVREVLQHAV